MPSGIILHDSDTPSRIDGHPMNAVMMERIHAQDHRNWATFYKGKTYHIGYHFIILPDGKVEEGRPLGCIGTHAKHFNDWIGICLIGGFSSHRHWYPETPTRAQLKALIRLCKQLMDTYHIPTKNVRRHRDVNSTYCPGDRFPYAAIMTRLSKFERRPLPVRPET